MTDVRLKHTVKKYDHLDRLIVVNEYLGKNIIHQEKRVYNDEKKEMLRSIYQHNKL